jgi:hypothetical protein
MLKPEGRRFDSRRCHWIISIYLIFPASLWPWGLLRSNRNEYQESSWGGRRVKRGWCVRLITSPPSVSRLFRKCWSLDISQFFRTPIPVTGTILLLFNKILWEMKLSLRVAAFCFLRRARTYNKQLTVVSGNTSPMGQSNCSVWSSWEPRTRSHCERDSSETYAYQPSAR